jgi:signal peptidase I
MKETKKEPKVEEKKTTKKQTTTKKKVSKEMKKVVKENKRINYEDIEKYSKEQQEEIVEANTKKAKKEAFMEMMPYLIIILFVILIRTFIMTPVNVNGTSMVSTLEDGDILLVYKLRYRLQGPKRFDIVTLKTKNGDLIKRVIGMPGDKLRYVIKQDDEGKQVAELYINDELVNEDFISDEAKLATCATDADICNNVVTVPEDSYYVMGDNRGVSLDSRSFGAVTKKQVYGITEIRIFPFNKMGNFNKR